MFACVLQNYGAFMETWGAGISGSVLVTGLPSGDQDLSAAKWVYQVTPLSQCSLPEALTGRVKHTKVIDPYCLPWPSTK